MTPVKWIIRETIFVFFLCMIWLGPAIWIKVGLTMALFSCELHDICTHILNGKKKEGGEASGQG